MHTAGHLMEVLAGLAASGSFELCRGSSPSGLRNLPLWKNHDDLNELCFFSKPFSCSALKGETYVPRPAFFLMTSRGRLCVVLKSAHFIYDINMILIRLGSNATTWCSFMN